MYPRMTTIRNNSGFIAPYVLWAIFGFLSVGSGVVAVSQNSVPGDSLYFIKEATRDARISIALTEEVKTKTELAISLEKTKEIKEMEERERSAVAIANAAENLSKNYELRTEAVEYISEENMTRVADYIDREQEILEEVAEKVPSPAKEAIEKAITNSGKRLNKNSLPPDVPGRGR